jgi:hypothetical protein
VSQIFNLQIFRYGLICLVLALSVLACFVGG